MFIAIGADQCPSHSNLSRLVAETVDFATIPICIEGIITFVPSVRYEDSLASIVDQIDRIAEWKRQMHEKPTKKTVEMLPFLPS